MNKICNQTFEGERPLYASHDLSLENVTILAGESALKESRNIEAVNCRFEGRYPFWETKKFQISNSYFSEDSRAPLWYSEDLLMRHTTVEAPKPFREMHRLELIDVQFPKATETLWHCYDIILKEVTAKNGDYFLFHSENIRIDQLHLDGKYSFQYVRNVEIHDSVLNTKDAFWESENVTVYDSEINGEYLGWYSKNLRLVNCRISGTQPLCYAQNLVLENCTFAPDADLAFEYSTVQAEVQGRITSVKNPKSGFIKADGFGEIILDEHQRESGACKILTR